MHYLQALRTLLRFTHADQGLIAHPSSTSSRSESTENDQSEWELSSVEGFVRQILGWREYMQGIYVHIGEEYPERNWFNHTQKLPCFC